jgi:predicted metal-dependent phosphoesterase TrpH
MLKFARNKLVSVNRIDQDTLSIHGILDDDIYSLEIDLRVQIENLQFLSVEGRWNRWTTPECPRAIGFLEEGKGFCIDDEIDNRIHKIVGRKGCRHFANLLIECCYAAKGAAVIARWEDVNAANPDLTFKAFVFADMGRGKETVEKKSSREHEAAVPKESARVAAAVQSQQKDPQPSQCRLAHPPAGFVIDLHVHTFPASPCSSASVDESIEEAKSIGLSGFCLTDHNYVWTPAQVNDLSQKHGFLILRGNEITTDQGDMLVFGWENDIQGIIKLQDLRAEVLRAGGFIIAAHPFRGFLTFGAGQLGLTPERAAQRALFQWVDAVEVLNGKVTGSENRLAGSVAASLGLPAVGGSDAHEVGEIGRYATRFSAEIKTEAELLTALRSGEYTSIPFRGEHEQTQLLSPFKAAER